MNRGFLAAVAVAASAVFAGAMEYQDAWGPPIGSAMPSFRAPDHTDAWRDLADLSGENGLLLFAVRSADW